MSVFTWLEAYKIGDEDIDRQHEYLFSLANEIVDPFNDAQKTHHNVLALFHYVKEHFAAEEALMKQYNYAGYAEHVEEHKVLTQKLQEISNRIVIGKIGPDHVMQFMRAWLLEHILGKDILLGEFLRQRKNRELDRV